MKVKYGIFIWLILFPFYVQAQIQALFVVNTNLVKTFSIRCMALETVATYQYIWDFGDTSGDTGTVVEHHYKMAGNYRVSLVVKDSVTQATDTVSQWIAIRDQLSIPNVFTPNNDDINDLFIIRSNGQNTYTFTVFTRSGVKVYKTTGKTIVWDGKTPAGVYVSSGVYYYVLTGDNGFYKRGFLYVIY